MKRTFQYIVAIAVLILAISSARLFWHKYWIGQDVEAAAIYGTKNRVDDTLAFLDDKLKKDGYDLKKNDFRVDKAKDKRVTISVEYNDPIRVFGLVLREVHFSIKKTASEVKDFL